MKHIAKPLPILDGEDKVRGRLLYASDFQIDDMLYCKLVFSSAAHARIKNIHLDDAMAVAGVVAVFHYGNTPDNLYNSTIWFADQEGPADEQMFPHVVRHKNDRVAAVVAETQDVADYAASLVDIEYEHLPVNLDVLEVSNYSNENPIVETIFEYGDPDSAFAVADIIVEDTISTSKTHHCALENHICIAMPEDDGRISIQTPCQSIFAVQAVVSHATGLPASQLRVIKTPIGGSFGGKAEPILDPLCVWFAHTLQRPVIIEFTREETFTATRTRSKAIGQIKTAVSSDGYILGRETDVVIDVGAYCTGGIFLPSSMFQRLCRIYDIQDQRYRGRSYYTNTVPTGAYRGYGSPQIHAISEINLNHVARGLGMDPVAFRLKNLIHPGATDPVTEMDLGNARIRDCVEQGAERFDWHNRWTANPGNSRFKRGVGMACATHINGCFPGFHEATTATLKLREDGEISLICALHDLGCGSNTVLAQIIAEVLDTDPNKIHFCSVDTDLCDYDLGTRASRMTYIVGEAVRRTSEKFKQQIILAASLRLNCATSDLRLAEGRIFLSGNRDASMSLEELNQYETSAGKSLNATETYRATANPGSYAAHFSEVEVDSLTGLVRVIDYLAVHDLGRAINQQLTRGQINGGIQMGIGYALFEDINIEMESGRMRGDRFSRYQLVNTPEMPRVDVLLVEMNEPSGPYGAKAVGEIATIPVAPAIVNAINHALQTNLTDLPITPERIIEALY